MARISRLAVLLSGVHVADVERTRAGVLRLTFTSEGRAPGRTPLSLSMPAEIGTHAGDRVEAYLWALLPDNDAALRAAEDQHGVDRTDPLALLSALGKDCAGAVQFCVPDEIEQTRTRDGGLIPISDAEIEARLDEMDTNEDASWTMPSEHWSLGGTQQKFALRRQADEWFIATGTEATTHIVKPGIRKLKAQALVEHVSMAAARSLGVKTALTAFESFKSQDAIVVERFDRRVIDGHVRRMHQEDICQALGVRQKYEEFGGPSALETLALLRDQSRTAAAARANVNAFIDGLVYNVVIGAPDAHARNFAVLLDGDDVRLAPLYDVASGRGYGTGPDVRRTVSMSVGGEFVLDQIDTEAWKRFAGEAEVDESWLLERVDFMADRAPGAFAEALSQVDDWDGAASEVRSKVLPALEENARRLTRRAGR